MAKILWMPGVLNKQQLLHLLENGLIRSDAENSMDLCDHSSMDLTLSDDAWHMPAGSIKPHGRGYDFLILKQKDLFVKMEAVNGEHVLLPRKTYLFRLEQKLAREFWDHSFHGQATAKSSIGRVDVLARLIVDGMDCYEAFTPAAKGGEGLMWVEITPITFKVRVKKGIPITQLRIFQGTPEESEMRGQTAFQAISHGQEDFHGTLCVDLEEIQISEKRSGCAFRAKSGEVIEQLGAIPLWEEKKNGKPNPVDYWDTEGPKLLHSGKKYFPVVKNGFYILRSKQRISIPPGICIYCKAIDETIGEMRIHYAGFVHPFFGYTREHGTPLIFEVRGHDVEVLLTDNEKLAKLILYRMSQEAQMDKKEASPPDAPGSKGVPAISQAPPPVLEIPEIEAEEPEDVAYTNQNLDLSKFFAKWKRKD